MVHLPYGVVTREMVRTGDAAATRLFVPSAQRHDADRDARENLP
jgi:hypothetical protein